MTKLHISSTLALPTSVVTATTVVLGGKGMGKTNLAAVMIEEMAAAGLRWRLLDPLGVSYGLRHAKDGKGKGVECLILGGVHGDIPIEPTAGASVADFLVEEDVNVIVDFSRTAAGAMWSIGEKTRFLTDLALRTFQLQGSLVDGRRRDPFCLILDEAARYIPQLIPAGNPQLAKCVSAWEQIAEEGRNIGIGVCFLTQRSARMNKSVTELADVLFAFRTIGPNSVDAITDWLGGHVTKDKIKVAIEQIRSLEVGQCMVVSPGWLKHEGIITVRERETFDSSATPKAGERQRKVSGNAAKPDLAKYATRMQETIEKAKADDPKALRAELATVKAQLNQEQKKVAQSPTKEMLNAGKADARTIDKARETGMMDERARWTVVVKRLKNHLGVLNKVANTVLQSARDGIAAGDSLHETAAAIAKDIAGAGELNRDASVRVEGIVAKAGVVSVRGEVFSRDAIERIKQGHDPRTSMAFQTSTPPVSGALRGLHLEILQAIAELNTIGFPTPAREQVGFYVGKAAGGGYFVRVVGELKTQELIEYPAPGYLQLTAAGYNAAGDVEPPRDLGELHTRVCRHLAGLHLEIAAKMLEHYPNEMTRADLGDAIGKAADGGYVVRVIGELKTAGIITYPSKGALRASDTLFPKDLA